MNAPLIPPTYGTVNHTLHLLLCLFTCGAWLFVWPFIALGVGLTNRSKRKAYQRQLNTHYASGGHA